jgi:hypothetical protein
MKTIRPHRKLEIEFGNEEIITPSGLSLVGAVLSKSNFVRTMDSLSVSDKRSKPYIKSSDCCKAYIGMLCQGKTQFEDVRELLEDPDYFKFVLGIDTLIPSPETLRQRMDSIGCKYRSSILKSNADMLTKCVEPTALSNGYIPLNIDVSPFDNSKSNKEKVSHTYKNFMGYAPIFAYLGAEGYLANAQLRPGSQHCQNGTCEFLKETLNLSHKVTDSPLLVRMDSGNDASANFGILIEDGSYFIVKHKRTNNETNEGWLSFVQSVCKNVTTPRDGKTVYIGSTWKPVEYVDSKGGHQTINMRMVYEVIERTVDKRGQYLLPADIEVNLWWVNVGLSDEEVIELYHQHGEMEQFHSEIKSDMDVERLPSGKFDTNELVLELTILAYNILRIIGQSSLKGPHAVRRRHEVKRLRLKTVIKNLILIAGHVVKHARKVFLRLGRSNI